ncbi:MAG: RsmB/NOP family class I SAM-dependent RNA methyltransferase [Magnetococcales bacterium]|nr:RsmB/NOP family class I SAM-dependent RNA methyltransferase [Magnetococcales bacterium]
MSASPPPSNPRHGVAEAALLLQRILPDPSPHEAGKGEAADQALEQFFRERHAGPKERARIADLVYYALRHRRPLERVVQHLLATHTVPDTLQLASAAAVALERETSTAAHPPEAWADWQPLWALLGHAATLAPPPLPPPSAAEQSGLPEWLWQRFSRQWGEEQALQLATALRISAPVDLRVNTLRATREEVVAALAAARIEACPTPHAPSGVRLAQRRPLQGLESFQHGWFEIQDEGSQLIAPLLTPRPGETIVDLCAGGGGKSLHLATLMGNRGRIVAADIEARRLLPIGPRSKRAGVRIIRTVALRHERDPQLKPLESKADAVLVDAPCSGLGTLRRRPEIQWQLQSTQIEAYHYRQCALLEAGARLTRPGGRLLYATCSLLHRENQEVVAAFLADNKNFRLQPVPMPATRPAHAPFFVLLPHQSATDGFFAALLLRIA